MEETRIEAKNAAQTVQNLRTPEAIAAEINYIAQKTRETVLSGAIEIGRRLVEAKELVPHGQWEQWLRENVSYSQSTANNLMAVFREYGGGQQSLFQRANPAEIADLSYSKAVALLVLPREQREEFLEQNPVAGMSTRQLQAAIKEAKEQLEQSREQLEQSIEERQKYQKQAGEEMGRANRLEQEAREAANREAGLRRQLEQLEEKAARPSQQALDEITRQAQEEAQAAAAAQLEEARRQLAQAQAEKEETARRLAEEKEAARGRVEEIRGQLAKMYEEKEEIAKRLAAAGTGSAGNGEMAQARLLLARLQEDFNRFLGLAMALENKGEAQEAQKLKRALAALCGKMQELVQ